MAGAGVGGRMGASAEQLKVSVAGLTRRPTEKESRERALREMERMEEGEKQVGRKGRRVGGREGGREGERKGRREGGSE